MTVRDNVVIKVDVDVKGMKKLDRLERKLDSISRSSSTFAANITKGSAALDEATDSLDKTNDRLDKHDRRMDRSNKRHLKFARTIEKVTAPLKKFIMTLGKMSFVAAIGQLGLFTAGLLTIKLALITGRAAVEVYNIALKGLSVAAAGAATAIAVAAAAMRQFNEAMLIPSVGGGMTQRGAQNAALLSRSIGTRTAGLLGGEATTSLVAAFAKAGVSRTRTDLISRQLFNLTGGDPAAVQALAKAIGSKDAGELSSAISGAAGFRADSLRSGMSTEQLLNAIASGSVVSENYKGVGGGLAGTFIGTAKTEFAGMKNMFADMGQPLLIPFREAMMDMAKIIRENFMGMSVLIQRFGADSFAPTLVTIVDKTMDFLRSNIFDHLGRIEEMGESFVGFFRSVRDFFRGMGAFLVQFEPAANVVLDMFRAMGATGGGRSLFRSFSDLIVKNAKAFEQFGASIGNVFGAIFDLLKSGQSGFFSRLDLFSEILDRVASEIIPAIGKLMESLIPILEKIPTVISGLTDVLQTLTPIVGAFASIIGFIGGLPGGGALSLIALMALLKPLMMVKAVTGLYSGVNTFTQFALNPDNAGKLKAYGQGAAIAGGTLMMVGGGAHIIKTGQSTGGALSMIGGGAMAGAALGSIIPGAGTAAGAAIGAAVGTVLAAASTFVGEMRRQDRIDEMLDASQTIVRTNTFTGSAVADARAREQELRRVNRALTNLETESMFTNDTYIFGKGRVRSFREAFGLNTDNLGDRAKFILASSINPFGVRSETEVDVTGQNFMDMKKYAETYLGMDFSEFKLDDFTDQFSPGGRVAELVAEDVQDRIREQETMEDNLDSLRRATNLTEETLENLANVIGVDLYNATLNTAGAAAIFLANALPLMDRNRAFLPSLNTSDLGQSELKATADAAFTTLGNAYVSGEVTTDLVKDAVESFAAFEIAKGISPDIAGLSALAEIREQIYPLFGRGDTYDMAGRRNFDNILKTATEQIFKDMGEEYDIPFEVLMAEAGFSGAIDSNLELKNVNDFLDRVDKFRRTFNVESGLTGSERLAQLRAQGFDVKQPGNLKDQILGAMPAGESGASARRLYGYRSLEDVLEIAESQGVNTADILIRELTKQGFLGEEDALAVVRNETLASIDRNIATIAGNGGFPTATDERGYVPITSPELARAGGSTNLSGGTVSLSELTGRRT